MENNSRITFFKPFLLLGIFIFGLGVLFLILSGFDQQRKEDIYQRYEAETQNYIIQNKPDLIKLFTQIFPNKTCYREYNQIQSCSNPTQSEIAQLLPSTLKDWSSTVFVKEAGGKILYMGLSGETGDVSNYSQDQYMKLSKLLNGQVEEIEWEDYVYVLPNKEVVFAVKDDSGKVVGAIVRGVIE